MQRRAQNVVGTVHNAVCVQHDVWIWRRRDLWVFVGIIQARQKMLHTIQTRPFLVVRPDHSPRRIRRIGVEKHRFLSLA